MNWIFLSQEVAAWRTAALSSKQHERALKDLERAIRDFQDEYGCLINGGKGSKNLQQIPRNKGNSPLYKRIALEFGLPAGRIR